MRTIQISGPPGSGKTTHALKLYDEYARRGRHVVLIDDGYQVDNSHPHIPPERADVLITTNLGGRSLKTTTTN